MSQFQIPGAPSAPSEQPAYEPGKTSGLAISSLICSLICCVPITTILAVLLGTGGLISIGKNPALRGRGMAITGIVLGVLFTIGQAVIYPVGWRIMKESMAVVMTGPADALAAGFADDVAGFKAEFYGAGANAPDAEVQAFIDELRDRYGEYIGSRFNEQAGRAQPGFGQTSAPFPYRVEFENATVDVETEIVFSDPQRGGIIMKIGSITVSDDERGDLSYPGGSGGGSATAPPADEDGGG